MHVILGIFALGLLLPISIFLNPLKNDALPSSSNPHPHPGIVLAAEILPARLSIPQIDLERVIVPVKLDDRGGMDTPKNDAHVGWYEYGVKPGEVGNAVLDGHYNLKDGSPGVFHRMRELKVGDIMTVTDTEGEEKTFVVDRIEIYRDTEFPIGLVFGPSDRKNLNLITCHGEFDPEVGEYRDRLVVFSSLLEF